MKTMVKLVMLLAVLAICMPAAGQGQPKILVYSKTVSCQGAEVGEVEGDDDIYRETARGFLILNAIYVDDEIVSIDSAIQIEYGRRGREKWADWDSHEFNIRRFNDDGKVVYSLSEYSSEGALFIAMMLQGKARTTRADPNEVPTFLNGFGLLNVTDDADMCRFSLRLHPIATREAAEQEMNIEEAYDMIRDWLNDRGYPLEALPA